MKNRRLAFTHAVRQIRGGREIYRETIVNLIPAEGIEHVLSVVLKAGTQIASWFVGIFEGNYTPQTTDTAATFPGLATETTSYTEATRPLWVGGTISGGSVDNSASEAQFTLNNPVAKTLYGDFLVSSSVKGGVTGTLLSVVRYTTPRIVITGDLWFARVTASLVSV